MKIFGNICIVIIIIVAVMILWAAITSVKIERNRKLKAKKSSEESLFVSIAFVIVLIPLTYVLAVGSIVTALSYGAVYAGITMLTMSGAIATCFAVGFKNAVREEDYICQ